MDDDRRIRFLVAPLLFFASLAWGFLRDPVRKVADILPGLKLEKLPDFFGVLVGGGVAVFTAGFVIGTLTYVTLRLAFFLKARFLGGSTCHEISFSDHVLEHVWRRVEAPGKPDRRQELFAGVTFDHGLLRAQHEGVQRWVVRRWNAFSVAVTSTTGLLLSIGIGTLAGLRLSKEWWLPVAIVSLLFVASAVAAWRDTMGMLSFQAMRPAPPPPQGAVTVNKPLQPPGR